MAAPRCRCDSAKPSSESSVLRSGDRVSTRLGGPASSSDPSNAASQAGVPRRPIAIADARRALWQLQTVSRAPRAHPRGASRRDPAHGGTCSRHGVGRAAGQQACPMIPRTRHCPEHSPSPPRRVPRTMRRLRAQTPATRVQFYLLGREGDATPLGPTRRRPLRRAERLPPPSQCGRSVSPRCAS